MIFCPRYVLLAALFVLNLVFAMPVHADIYRCVDGSGRITYTNARSPGRGCSVLTRDPPAAPARKEPARSGAWSGKGTSGGDEGGFPRVDSSTQQSRDTSRRAILQRELASEEKLLAEARQAALRSYANAPGARVVDDKVELHERNIQALKKEISKLK